MSVKVVFMVMADFNTLFQIIDGVLVVDVIIVRMSKVMVLY